MVIVMKPEATKEEIKLIIDRIEGAGLKAHVVEGEFQTIIGVTIAWVINVKLLPYPPKPGSLSYWLEKRVSRRRQGMQ